MEHQVQKVHQEIKVILEIQGHLGQLGKEDCVARQVFLVRENKVKMACQDSQGCQVRKVIQDHLVCQENQDYLDLVNQDSQDQRVTKVWVDHLDFQDLKVIRVTVGSLACLDHQDQMASGVLLVLWGHQEV